MKEIILNNVLQGKTYPDAGSDFYGILKNAIQSSERVYINMEGVTGMPTMFMNTSFGKIMSEFGLQKLKSTMVFRNITKVQIERIGKYFTDYSEVYNTPT